MNLFIFFILLFFSITSAYGTLLQTDTHTYILSQKHKAILIINRQTAEEILFPLPRYPKYFAIHNSTGYVIQSHKEPENDSIAVIDLKTHTLTHTIQVGKSARSMTIHQDRGYVLNWWSDSLSIIDLKTNTLLNTIDIFSWPCSMTTHDNLGYILCERAGTIEILDLKTHTIIKSIKGWQYPHSMLVHNNVGYVVNNESGVLDILDLQELTKTTSISIGTSPEFLIRYGDSGFVLNTRTDEVAVIDLLNPCVIKKIPVSESPTSMLLHQGYLYVIHAIQHYRMNVTVIDPKTFSILGTLQSSVLDTLGFSDTHIYIGCTKNVKLPEPVLLFDQPYGGLCGPLFDEGTGEDAFRKFEEAMEDAEFQEAKIYLKEALNACHPKACAFAAYAFFYQKWGAVDQKDFIWFTEFGSMMDLPYFHRLTNCPQNDQDFCIERKIKPVPRKEHVFCIEQKVKPAPKKNDDSSFIFYLKLLFFPD